MKAFRSSWWLLFWLVGAVFQTPAQPTDADLQRLADLRAKAESGDPRYQQMLGAKLFVGRLGVPKDALEAVTWYRKAADQNYAPAQYDLGFCYAYGQGVAKDDAQAARWFRKAADQNHAAAQYRLGLCYASGQGVPKDVVQAVKWYQKAAAQNEAEAEYRLGLCHLMGEGVPRDEAQAVKWYHKAASQHHAEAQRELGLCYQNGQGVPVDEVEAVRWYREAADQNDAVAQSCLGDCYAKGEGVEQDKVQAHQWLRLAAGQGYDPAKKALPLLDQRMSPAQIAEGEKLAQTFKPLAVSQADGSSPNSCAMGFFISEDGYLITSAHVVQKGADLRVATEAGTRPAQVVKLDVADGLALLKVEGTFVAVPMISSRALRLGSTVANVGFRSGGSQGFVPKLAKGEITALSGAQDDPRYFRLGLPAEPGNAGSALVDERGNVVGVVSTKVNAAANGTPPEEANYALKSSYLLSFLESMPDVSARLKPPSPKESKPGDVMTSAEKAAARVVVY